MIFPKRLLIDEEGATLPEFAIVMLLFFLVIGGLIDFGTAFVQYNQMTKAVERGARIAAVSSPVANGLQTLNTPAGCSQPGDAWPGSGSYDIQCTSSGCTGTGASSVTYDSTAMNWIVYGRGRTSCTPGGATSGYAVGMCDILSFVPASSPLTTANVIIRYKDTGLGFCGRPAGPIPTIEVSLRNVPLQFFFLRGLMGSTFADSLIGTIRASITGEDMCSGPYGTDSNNNPTCNTL